MAASVAVALALASHPAAAQTEQTLKKDSAAQSLEQANQSLEATQTRTQELESQRKSLGKEIAQLNRQIIETASRVQDSELRLTELERSLTEREARRKGFEAEFGREAKKLSAILVSLQRMGANPPPAIITHRRDALSMVRSALMLSKIFPQSRDQAVALRHKLETLDEAIVAERTERDKVKGQRDSLDADRAGLEKLMETSQDEHTRDRAPLPTGLHCLEERWWYRALCSRQRLSARDAGPRVSSGITLIPRLDTGDDDDQTIDQD